MRNLTQVLRENKVTEEQLYHKYVRYQKNKGQNHNSGMSMHMSFSKSEIFVLAALGLNYLEDVLTHRMEDSKQLSFF